MKCSHHISASVILRNKIPTDPNVVANPEFNGAIPNTVDVTGSRVFKDGGRQTEVLISQLPYQIATPYQRLTHHFRGPQTQRLYCDVTGSRVLKMAATKPEVLIYRLLE